MSEEPVAIPAAEQAEQDPTKAAALAWAEAAGAYASAQEKHYDELSSKALKGNTTSYPGSVPAGFDGTEIDRQILQAEGSYEEEDEPTPAQEAASEDAYWKSYHYQDAAEYFALVKAEIQDDAFDLEQEGSLAALESQRQAELAQEKPDTIGQQVDSYEANMNIGFSDEIARIRDSQWYRDNDSSDHYAH